MTEDPGERPSETEHDPYARRPGYATSVDGRTDRTPTAVVAGVVAAFVGLFVSGLLTLPEWVAFTGSAALGVVVWLVLRSRQRARARRAGTSPDAVAEARDRATAEANGGRRFFIAPNPVVLIVVAAVALGVAVAALASGVSGRSIAMAVLAGASGITLLVQGIGTLVVRRSQG